MPSMKTWLLCLTALALAAQDPQDLFGEQPPTPPPQADDDKLNIPKKAAATQAQRTPYDNGAFRAKIDELLRKQNLDVRRVEGERLAFDLVGNAKLPDEAELLKLAHTAMGGLDTWTGGQGIFAGPLPAAQKIRLVIMPDDRSFDRLHDDLGVKSDNDLAKKLKSINDHSVRITTASKVGKAARHYAVYAAICASLDLFYKEYGIPDGTVPAPSWLREGINAEMQRLVVGDRNLPVAWMTISYEMNDPKGLTNDWANDIKTYINGAQTTYKGKLLPARQVTELDVVGLDPIQYRQMWSFCNFVRANAGTAKGPSNRFFKLLLATARGTSSNSHLITEWKWKDPDLSQRWVAWALQQ